MVHNALDYLLQNAPPIRTAVARDSPEWKDFVAKPSLKFVLRLLTGLAHSHVTTQLALAADSIPLFHHLEQISSDEHVGSLAENLLEAMRGHPKARQFTLHLNKIVLSNPNKSVFICICRLPRGSKRCASRRNGKRNGWLWPCERISSELSV